MHKRYRDSIKKLIREKRRRFRAIVRKILGYRLVDGKYRMKGFHLEGEEQKYD